MENILRVKTLDYTDIENNVIENLSVLESYFCVNDLRLAKKRNKKCIDDTIFGLQLRNIDEDIEESLFLKINIDDLEFFAKRLLNQIEMVRRDYKDELKFARDNNMKV